MIGTAFLLGLIGSLHCIGMCAPLALALPYAREQRYTLLFQTLKYNFGRALTYAFQGSLLGFLGQGLLWSGLQQSLSIFIGFVFVGVALWSFGLKNTSSATSFFQVPTAKFRYIFGKILRGSPSHFLVGMVNGLLPCGLVYWALATSVLLFSPIKSAIFMFSFGVGTMPLMIAAVVGSRYLNRRVVAKLYKWLPVYQLLLGFLLIGRGLMIDAAAFWQLKIVPMCH
jgi:sulfite exporter TauE/SafE